MEKYDIFEAVLPDGQEITAISIYAIPLESYKIWICYGDNKLFIYKDQNEPEFINEYYPHNIMCHVEIICDNCIIKMLDNRLEEYNNWIVSHAEDL